MAQLRQVLYVEDNEDDVHLVKSALVERGVDIQLHVVANAVLAFSFMAKQGAYAQSPSVDLVILDINLPIITGVKALNIIKNAPEWRNIPVIILTSSERPEDRSQCVRMGVIGYQVKPKLWDEYLRLADTLKEAITTGCVSGVPEEQKRSQVSGSDLANSAEKSAVKSSEQKSKDLAKPLG